MPFLVFEGLNGAGKSTLISSLQSELESRGQGVVVTREPGGTPYAEEIRELLLKDSEEGPEPLTELLLYQASRAQHVKRVIQPARTGDRWVLCDRYTASTLAFQAGGRGLNEEMIEPLNDLATGHCYPDLWVLLDLPVEEGLNRTLARKGEQKDRFEKETIEFQERVRQHFLKQAEQKVHGDWLVMDARQSPEDLLQALLQTLRERQWLD